MQTLSAAIAVLVLALCAPPAAGTRRRAPGSVAGDAGIHGGKLVNDTVRMWRAWAHLRASHSHGKSSTPGGAGMWDPLSKFGPFGETMYAGSGCEDYCEDMKKEGVPKTERCTMPPCQKCKGCGKLIAATAPFLEVGTIKVGGYKPMVSSVQSFKFTEAFGQVPIVVITANTRGPNPAHIRVKDVTKEGFKAVITEPMGENGPHGEMDVPYMAVAQGRHTLPDGRKLEAGALRTKDAVQSWRCKHKGPLQKWKTLKFKTSFPRTPALVTTIQTMANEKNSVPKKTSNPFLTVATRGLTKKRAMVGLERAELGKTGKLTKAETIGYVAMTTGTGDLKLPGGKAVAYASVISRDIVVGWGDRSHKPEVRNVAFGKDLGTKPLVVASQVKRDGDDGGWVRIHSARGKGAKVVIDEDRGCDRERTHKTERVALIAWSAPCKL